MKMTLIFNNHRKPQQQIIRETFHLVSKGELDILDLLQVPVETLDKCFENVSELGLIFHVDKYSWRNGDGGMVMETNMNEIVTQTDAQNKLEKSNMNFPEIPRNINIGDMSIKVPNLTSFKIQN
ncbi:unnamed protein product [Nyctereutes procyonoides]|uniref:(raccoon dog) hypothetical protein n=1 Tax=Nyctereutes procyonoides TaxID=34880 RepID=A0A811YP53_NYCPR|nr:unnamed protein product [Nyctereutes procyonoides]CAD7688202.1 unnamed protein product [Nyctereutes procyonoides]